LANRKGKVFVKMKPHWVNVSERLPANNSELRLVVVGPERNESWPVGYAKGSFTNDHWVFSEPPDNSDYTRVVAWLEGTVLSNHELYNVPKDGLKF
jgi:hypothetical protein